MGLFGYKKKSKPATWLQVPGAKPVAFRKATPRPRQPCRRIRPISKRQRQLNAQYSPMAAKYKLEHPVCECCALVQPGQQPNPTEDVHHKKGRGKYLLAVEFWVAACRPCHDHIGANPAWAYSVGLLIRRGK